MPKITLVGAKKGIGASTKSGLSKPAAAGGIKKPSHAKLAARVRALGRAIPKRAKMGVAHGTVIANPLGHTGNAYLNVVNGLSKGATKFDAKKFNRTYRKAFDAQDELLSTSTVREFLGGVIEGRAKEPMTAAHDKRINDVFDRISRVRFPTRSSGFALKSLRMQHPTDKSKAQFDDPDKTASMHSELDRARKQAVVEAMEEAIKDPKWSIESVTEAGLRRAISFTLNEFTAPATASDVAPFMRRQVAAEQREQARGRERLKDTFVKLGGKRETGADNRAEREWGSRRGKNRRDVSPTRKFK